MRDRAALLVIALWWTVGSALVGGDAVADDVKTRRTSSSSGLYAVNLESALSPFSEGGLPAAAELRRYRLYTTQIMIEGRLWYRLRLGFFPSRKAAGDVREALLKEYPRSWITKVTPAERAASTKTALYGGTAAPAPVSTPMVSNPATAVPSTQRLDKLMEAARQAMARGDYTYAIKVYTAVVEYPDYPRARDAQEYLGLARERNGQLAHAMAEYEKYLELYPKGEGAERVRQRLDGLLTARSVPPQKLRQVTVREDQPTWDEFGSFSQYYRLAVSRTDSTGQQVNLSLLSSDLDFMARRRTQNYELRTRFTGGYDADFLSGGHDQTRITSMYVEGNDTRRIFSGRFGGQSQSSGGVLGRFDGAQLGYQATPITRINFVTGFPVEFNSLDRLSTDKVFYGASIDLGAFANAWDVNTYFIEQTVGDLTDRRAVGSELRYSQANRSLFALVDYDIYFSALNTFFVFGNWILPDTTSFNFTVDFRKSPILTTSNALQGQTVGSVSGLLDLFSKDEIKQLAQDRTADSRTYTLGVTRPINRMLQISGDVTMTNLSGTPASGGVLAIDGTGNDYFYSVQLIGSSLIKEGDLAILGLRYSDTSTAQTTTFTINTRYPVNNNWHLNPRLRVDWRTFTQDNSKQWTVEPSIRINYRFRRHYQFELEGGTDWSAQDLTSGTENSSGYYVSLGYRADF
jgi:tetratricopeptide (TPR) repeat protein